MITTHFTLSGEDSNFENFNTLNDYDGNHSTEEEDTDYNKNDEDFLSKINVNSL